MTIRQLCFIAPDLLDRPVAIDRQRRIIVLAHENCANAVLKEAFSQSVPPSERARALRELADTGVTFYGERER